MLLNPGDIIELKIVSTSNNKGDVGIVLDKINGVFKNSIRVLFSNGEYDIFSEMEQDWFLKKKGTLKNFDYKFSSRDQLYEDWNKAKFWFYFQEIKKMNICNSSNTVNYLGITSFDEELNKLLEDCKISRQC